MKREVAASEIVKAAKKPNRDLIENVNVFDVYEGDSVGPSHKSIAITIRIQPKDKTLTEVEIESIATANVASVTAATGAVLRTSAIVSLEPELKEAIKQLPEGPSKKG